MAINLEKTRMIEEFEKIFICSLCYVVLKRGWNEICNYDIGTDDHNHIIFLLGKENISFKDPHQDFLYFLHILFEDLGNKGFKVLFSQPFERNSFSGINFAGQLFSFQKNIAN